MRTKTRILLLCTLFPIFLSAQTVHLFNCKGLDNWYAFDAATGNRLSALELFSVEKKCLRLYGKKAGYLMSKQSFANFKLSAQFKWNTDSSFSKSSKTKNSGIMYLVPDTAKDALWPAGIQFQIKSGSTGDFILLCGVTCEIDGKTTTAGKSVIYSKTADAEKKMGKWNSIEIIVKDNIVTQKLNGKVVNKANNPSVNRGRTLLQYEGYPIDFRKIKMEEF
ncbi:MAG: DUF1080 domain-containing protein [Paludibacteraceae bacterium]